MKAIAIILAYITFVLPAFGQDGSQPVLKFELATTEAIPGQAIQLNVTILVPTYMPKAPIWPSFEAPNVMVRLPGRATSPTSQRVDGQNWSGIIRQYQITPMVPGRFVLPPRDIIVTYADPDTNKPTSLRIATDPLSFAGVVPPGGEKLAPFLAAQGLYLESKIEGDPQSLVPGEAVIWEVSAHISGVSPMFLPNLIPTIEVEGVSVYPDEPIVEETLIDGGPGGSRVERVTLMATGGGSGSVPGMELKWFNLQTSMADSTAVGGFPIKVEGPPAQVDGSQNWRGIGLASLAIFILAVVLYLPAKKLCLALLGWVTAGRQAWLASETRSFLVLQRAVSSRNYDEMIAALDDWNQKARHGGSTYPDEISEAVIRIGAVHFAEKPPPQNNQVWLDLMRVLQQTRKDFRKSDQNTVRLRALNPF